MTSNYWEPEYVKDRTRIGEAPVLAAHRRGNDNGLRYHVRWYINNFSSLNEKRKINLCPATRLLLMCSRSCVPTSFCNSGVSSNNARHALSFVIQVWLAVIAFHAAG